jgi:hypothetical protein
VRVQLAVLARYAEVEEQMGLLNLTGAGIDIFGVRSVPADLPVHFALQLRFEEQEVGIERQVTLAVKGADLAVESQPASFSITPQLGPYHAAGWQGIYAVAGGIVLPVTAAGTYFLDVMFDGESEPAGSVPFQVFLDAE